MYAPVPQVDGQPRVVHPGSIHITNLRRFALGTLVFLFVLIATWTIALGVGPFESPEQEAVSNKSPEVRESIFSVGERTSNRVETKEKNPAVEEPVDVLPDEGEEPNEEEDDDDTDDPLVDADVSEEEQEDLKDSDDDEDVKKPVEPARPKAPIRPLDYGKCEYWTKHVKKEFPEQCRYWMGAIQEWESSVNDKSHKHVAYFCNGDTSCHGWGDRLAGVLAAFFKALNMKLAFRIGHDYLSTLFRPCVIGTERRITDWTSNPFKFHYGKSCIDANLPCSTLFKMDCATKQDIVGLHTNRVCLDPKRCKDMKEVFGEAMSAVHLVGCPSRALFEPSKELFEDTLFPFKVDGKVESLSLKAIQALFEEKYHVIAIQMRLGDQLAFGSSQQAPQTVRKDRKLLMTPLKCATTIEANLKPSKPVRYFLATDTLEYRKLVEETFEDKIMAFEVKPEHIGSTNQKFGLAKELAEWYVLGLGDQLVLNKVGLDASYFKGRISAFAKTAWVHHLKHMVFDAGTCRNYSVTLDGTWDDLKKRGCTNPNVWRTGEDMHPQEHMKALHERNLTFPDWYVNLEGDITAKGFKVPTRPEGGKPAIRATPPKNDDDDSS